MALPKPTLQARPSAGLSFLTDESLFAATGVRLGFSRRQGGVSEPPYDGLNLGDHVEDDPMAVAENRALLLDAAGLGSTRLLTLNQVHGDVVLALDDDAAAAWEEVARAGAAGADGVAVAVPDVTALLCFADCTPVIVVSPSGRLRRGPRRLARRARTAFPPRPWRALARRRCRRAGARPSILPNTTPTSARISARSATSAAPTSSSRFVERFGSSCVPDERRIDLDLEAAVRASLAEAGIAPRAHRVVGRVHRLLVRRPLLLVSQTRAAAAGATAPSPVRKANERCEYSPSAIRTVAAEVADGSGGVRAARPRSVRRRGRVEDGWARGRGRGRSRGAPGTSARTAPTRSCRSPPRSLRPAGTSSATSSRAAFPRSSPLPRLSTPCTNERHVPRRSIAAAAELSGKVQDVLHRGERVGRGVARAGSRRAEAAGMLVRCGGRPAPRVACAAS